MYGYIDNIDFHNLEAEKYWSFPKSYKGDPHKETKNFIMSEEYLGAEKMDGHYARLIKDEDGNIILQGRSKSVSGEYLDKHEWVPQLQKFFDWLPNGTCLLGELYFPNQRGSRKVTTILGCLVDKAIARQEAGEKLCYYVFDIWAWNGESYLGVTAENRFARLMNSGGAQEQNCGNQYVKFAKYSSGQSLWDKLGEVLSSGGEGIVITRANSKPEPGKRTARKTLKVKMEIEQTIDAFLDGNYKPPTRLYGGNAPQAWLYWENVKTGEKVAQNKYPEYANGQPWEPVSKAYYNNWASAVSFSVMKDGKPVRIGWISGITEELKNGIVNEPEKWINKVGELSAMEIEHIDGNFSLRHAKIIQWRADKSPEDCDFSQIN